MFTGYLAYAGNELVNSARAAAYSAALGITTVSCGDCDTIGRATHDTEYTSPDMDDAPWWDPIEPHSKDFAGFVGLEVSGLGRTVATRGVVPLTEDGASLHPLRRPHREIQVKMLALARTEAAMSYGFSWLASALRGQICATGCLGDSLCFFSACPTCAAPPDTGTDTCGDPFWRTMRNVGVLTVDGPADVQRISGGWLAQITVTFAAGDPFIYRDPVLVATGPQPSQTMPDYADPGVPPTCFEAADCLRDATCPPPPAPVLPPPPADLCFPTGPFTAGRFVIPLTTGIVPIWAEKVPYIRVRSGGKQLKRLTIRWYGNPLNRDCADVDPCSSCAEVNVAFVPANSILTIDGRSQVASVDCPGGPGLATAEPLLYGRGGTAFVWPVFSCDTPMCLEVIAEADSVADDAAIDIYYVVREDAV